MTGGLVAHGGPAAADPAVRDWLAVAHGAGYLGLALFVGGLAFLALLWPDGGTDRRARAALVGAWLTGLAGTVATAGLEGAYATRGSLGDAFTPGAYRAVLDTDPGVALAARGLLWVLAAVVLATVLQGGAAAARSPGWRVGAAAVALGLLRATGMYGHPAEGPDPTLGQLADLLHLLGVSLWIGGLGLLLVAVLPRRSPEELARVVPAYSRLAAGSVAVIALAGLVLAWQVVGTVDALLGTSYGRLLVAKVALVGAVLLAALFSRRWVLRRLDTAVRLGGDAATVRPFVYSVAAETALVLAVLAATSVLVTSTPGR
ncbi:copper resistance D family protein [Streptomyces sp. NPDC127098]|uniref:copper resistance D family protein n=1 Tax=Streptomyces sp. NPDC127098 TaxID=3347137 RepID=UPI00364B25C4